MDVVCDDPALLAAYRRHLQVGKLFAFLHPDFGRTPGMEWLFPAGSGTLILPLGTTPHLELPGGRLLAPALPTLDLGVLASDRDLYRPGADPVRLLVTDPFRPLARVDLALVRNGVPYATHPLRLDRHGAGILVVPSLPEGVYTASRAGQPGQRCSFRVATHRLAPFTAWITASEPVAGRPSQRDVTLALERLGDLVDGRVRADLVVGGRRAGSATHRARDGQVTFRVPMARAGAHQLHLQLLRSPECTASVSLTGESWDGRGGARLGSDAFGAKAYLHGTERSLPPVHGLHVVELSKAGPFTLEEGPGRTVRLVACQAVGPTAAVLRDPAVASDAPGGDDDLEARSRLAALLVGRGDTRAALRVLDPPATTPTAEEAAGADLLWEVLRLGPARFPEVTVEALGGTCPLASRLLHPGVRIERRDRMAPGEFLEFEVPSPAGLLCVGTLLDGHPWEGWRMCLAPKALTAGLEVPDELRAGEEATLRLDFGEREGSAVVTVRDTRRTASEPLARRLARGLVDFATACGELGRGGFTGWQALRSTSGRTPAVELAEMHHLASCLRPDGTLDLDRLDLDPELSRGIPEHLAHRYKCLPVLLVENTLVLALVNPSNRLAVDDVRLITGFEVLPVAAREEQILRYVHREFGLTDMVAVDQPCGELLDEDTPGAPEAAPPMPSCEGRSALEVHLVSAASGTVPISVSIPPDAGVCTVEALVLSEGEWWHTERVLTVARGPRPILEVPSWLEPEEGTGRLRVASDHALCRVEVWRDGHPVPLAGEGGDYRFPLRAGDWRARAEDVEGRVGEDFAEVRDLSTRTVRVRSLRWLGAGDRLRRQEEGWVDVRVLSGVGPALQALVDSVARYPHGCCEQTAARAAVAATSWLLQRERPASRRRAEDDLRQALGRLLTMQRPGGGFALYPFQSERAEKWLEEATVRHLKELRELPVADLPTDLRELVQATLEHPGAVSASRVGDAYHRREVPSEEMDRYRERARVAIAAPIQDSAIRAEVARLATLLLRHGAAEDRPLARRLANGVLRGMTGGGRLYSTLDSVAAVSLLQEMERSETTPSARWSPDGEEVEVLEGDLLLALVTEEPSERSDSSMVPFRARLVASGDEVQSVPPGAALDLVLELPHGYVTGDTFRVYLPESLACLDGGAQLRHLWLDLEGRSTLRVSLVAVGEGSRPVFLQLENMYQELRSGAPVLLPFRTAQGDHMATPAPEVDAPPLVAVEEEERHNELVDRALAEAVRTGATWVHLEPHPMRSRVRLRRDGELLESPQLVASYEEADRAVRWLHWRCRLNREYSGPQTGDLRWQEQEVACRFLPGLHGRMVTLRVGPRLDPRLALEEVGRALAAGAPLEGLSRARASLAAATVEAGGLEPGHPLRHLLDGLSRLLGLLACPEPDSDRVDALIGHLEALVQVAARR